MAELTTGSTEIDAAPDAVMRVLTDFDAYPEWAGVKTAEVRATRRDRPAVARSR